MENEHMSHTAHLIKCRRALQTSQQKLKAAERLLRKLRDAGYWGVMGLEVDPYKADAQTGAGLIEEIRNIVGAKKND